jgi:hypothetical protein
MDPGRLQYLGKQAAALYSSNGTPLSDAVVQVVGREDIGPEHTKRVCEFANQAAYQGEWEKGGSVRNIEFRGGPADPSWVLKELNDGSRQDAVRVSSDYDFPVEKRASANRVEEEIFSGYTSGQERRSEVPSSLSELNAVRETINGASDHIFSKVAGLEVTKEHLGIELADEVKKLVLDGTGMDKIASIWSAFTVSPAATKEALQVVADKLVTDKVASYQQIKDDLTKTAAARVPNPAHPIVSRFIEFSKVAAEIKKLRRAMKVLDENKSKVASALKIRLEETGVGR